MPPEPGNGPPAKLNVVVFSGDFERVHYAFAMAAAVASVNRPVTLFFTMGALKTLLKPTADGAPGWTALEGAAERDADFAGRGVAAFEELVAACATLGVKLMVCEMGLRAMGLMPEDLRDDLDYTPGGTVSFLNDARADGALLFV
ncbi:MAG: DsrE/DsrF/DrsH-like family protein [Alphaproteobacteria bacterium]